MSAVAPPLVDRRRAAAAHRAWRQLWPRGAHVRVHEAWRRRRRGGHPRRGRMVRRRCDAALPCAVPQLSGRHWRRGGGARHRSIELRASRAANGRRRLCDSTLRRDATARAPVERAAVRYRRRRRRGDALAARAQRAADRGAVVPPASVGDGAPATAGGDGVVRCTVPRPAAPGAIIVQLSHGGRSADSHAAEPRRRQRRRASGCAPAHHTRLIAASCPLPSPPSPTTWRRSATRSAAASSAEARSCRRPPPTWRRARGGAAPASLPSGSLLSPSRSDEARRGARRRLLRHRPRHAARRRLRRATVRLQRHDDARHRHRRQPPAAARRRALPLWHRARPPPRSNGSTTSVRGAAPPRATPGELRLALSVEGGLTSVSSVPFWYSDASSHPLVDTATPAFGALGCGHTVRLGGANFAPVGDGRLLCVAMRREAAGLVQHGAPTAAAFVSGGAIDCPLGGDAEVGTVQLHASIDGGASWSV